MSPNLETQQWESFHSGRAVATELGKVRGGHGIGKGQFSFQLQRAMPKTFKTTIELCSFHILARLCSKSFKLGFSST